MIFLKLYYKYGKGFKQNYSKAIEYLQKASGLGNSNGLHNLGVCYKNGEGVKHNYSRAFEFFQKASELGNIKSFPLL